MWNTEVSPKIDVGETIVFNQNDSTNDNHPILILTGGTERVGGSSANQVIHDGSSYTLNYYKNDSVSHAIGTYASSDFGSATNRKVEFKTTVPAHISISVMLTLIWAVVLQLLTLIRVIL